MFTVYLSKWTNQLMSVKRLKKYFAVFIMLTLTCVFLNFRNYAGEYGVGKEGEGLNILLKEQALRVVSKTGSERSVNTANNTLNGTNLLSRNTLLNLEIQSAAVCVPIENILFLKTHKTGSSTITSILQVYGLSRNLKFAIAENGTQILTRGFFIANLVPPGKYNMFVNHARYKRDEMEKVMKPGTKYITILRDSETQIESVFGYFFFIRKFKLENKTNPFKTFVSNPSYYWNKYKDVAYRNYLKNPNFYDLGLSSAEQDDILAVLKYIERFSREFDLVLIQEYFNESLLVLKQILCLSIDDILYLPKSTRSPNVRFDIDPELRSSIHRWSWADRLLYVHFNKTLWKRIEEYGPSFNADLKELELKLNKTLYNCTLPKKKPYDNLRETHLIKHPKRGPKCDDLMRKDLHFTELIRKRQFRETILET